MWALKARLTYKMRNISMNFKIKFLKNVKSHKKLEAKKILKSTRNKLKQPKENAFHLRKEIFYTQMLRLSSG